MTLGPNQRGIVRSTLMLLEQRLAEIDQLLDTSEAGALYRRPRPDLDEEQRARVDAILDQIRTRIRALAARYDLPVGEQDSLRRIAGLLSIAWQELGELEPGRLRAWGPVDPRLAASFEPERRILADLVLGLEALVSSLPSTEAGDHEA